MKLILINGCSCVGKSTVVKGVLRERERLYHLSYDSLKRSFSQYSPGKYVDDIQTLKLAVAKTMFGLGYDIICDAVIGREAREKLMLLAKGYDSDIIEINLEADHERLIQRFHDRVALAATRPDSAIINRSIERWEEIYVQYQNEKNPDAETLRTDTEGGPEETIQAVLHIIASH